MSGVPINEFSKFIDVGGGKGGTAVFATQLGFKYSASLELEAYLHKVAKKNIEVLNLQNRVDLIHADAFKYYHYAQFSHIFMLRPLNGIIMRDLLLHIKNNLDREKRVYFLMYGGIPFDYINETLLTDPGAILIKNQICPYRENEIRVVVIN